MSSAFSAVALIAAYNEADIIELAVRDLIANGILVYLIDDGSTDHTVRLVEPFVGRGVIHIERLESPRAADEPRQFAWERLLRRKTQLAGEIDADWFLHHDADEFRESPWTGVTLVEGLRRVDALGYNAIDFANLDFWPTHDNFTPGSDPRAAFHWYSEAATYDRVQVRCWRKTAAVDLASSGGHDARFHDRRVFPIRFISRHYPIRGQSHGERKVFAERRPRFTPKERARKWHVQYDDVQEGASFIRDRCDLTRYDGDAVRTALTLRHRGVEALEGALAESRSAVEAAQCEAEATRRDVQSAREEIARQQRQIAEDRNRAREALDAHVRELGEAHAQLAQLHGALHARNLEVIDLHAQLSQTQAEHGREASTLREALTIRDEALAAARTGLAAARAESAMREQELASQSFELVRIRAGLRDVHGRLDAVHQSWSWRVTAPIRALLRWVRGY